MSRGAKMPDREELHEFHVDERCAGAQRERIAVAAHVGRRAVAAIEPRQPAGGHDRRLGGDGDRRAARQMQPAGTDHLAILAQQVDDQQVAGQPDPGGALDRGAQRPRDGRAGVEKVDIDAARAVVARRHGGGDVAVFTGPADAPLFHFEDTLRPFLAQQLRQPFVAEPAAGLQGVAQMVTPVIGRLLAQRDRDGHLRHHGGAAAPDQAAVEQEHRGAAPRRLDGRIHAGAARSNDQDVGFDVHGLCGHARRRSFEELQVPLTRARRPRHPRKAKGRYPEWRERRGAA